MHGLLVPASPARDRSAVAAWIAEAVGRREKVLYKHAPTEDAAAVLGGSLPEVGVDPAVLTSGQVQLADTTALRARTGGGHEALLALHRHQLGEATRAGFAGLAMTGDAAAMLTVTSDEHELAGYERGLERLAVEAGVRSLCRYTTDQRQALLDGLGAAGGKGVRLALAERAAEDREVPDGRDHAGRSDPAGPAPHGLARVVAGPAQRVAAAGLRRRQVEAGEHGVAPVLAPAAAVHRRLLCHPSRGRLAWLQVPARPSGSSWRSRGSTGTTAVPRSWPGHCATPGSR